MDEILNTIKQRGYWRINLRPLMYREQLESAKQCKSVVERCAVSLRGWEYPAILEGARDVSRTYSQDHYELSNTFWNYIEMWRMYKSGQFIHYMALSEDWLVLNPWVSAQDKQVQPMTRLGVVGLIYHATEIYTFLARLAEHGLYDDGVNVDIALHKTKGRVLWVDDPTRMSFSSARTTGSDSLVWQKHHQRDELVGQSTELARTMLTQWFGAFGWQPSSEMLAHDQQKLLTRTL